MKGSGALCQVGSVLPMAKGGAPKNGFLPNKMAAERKGKRTADIARQCAYDLIHHETSIKTAKLKPAHTKYTSTMRRTVKEISEKHRIFLDSAMKKLDITEESARTTIDNVANEMFVDNTFNWGRLVTLYAFCAKVANYLAERYPDKTCDLVEKIADYTADYVAETLSCRIEQHGGWDAFVDYFPEPENLENTVWKGLLYTAVGLGALATMLVVR